MTFERLSLCFLVLNTDRNLEGGGVGVNSKLFEGSSFHLCELQINKESGVSCVPIMAHCSNHSHIAVSSLVPRLLPVFLHGEEPGYEAS